MSIPWVDNLTKNLASEVLKRLALRKIFVCFLYLVKHFLPLDLALRTYANRSASTAALLPQIFDLWSIELILKRGFGPFSGLSNQNP